MLTGALSFAYFAKGGIRCSMRRGVLSSSVQVLCFYIERCGLYACNDDDGPHKSEPSGRGCKSPGCEIEGGCGSKGPARNRRDEAHQSRDEK
jgi:hypothetical protein